MKMNCLNLFFILLALVLFPTREIRAQKGSSKIARVKEYRPINAFQKIEVSGLAVVYLSQGPTEKAKVKVSGMPADEVITTVKEGTLTVTTQGKHSGESVKVYVSSPSVQSIKVGGAAKLYATDRIQGEKLDVFVLESAEAALEVDIDTLKIVMKDAANLRIGGKAGRQHVKSYNSRGSLDNSKLEVSHGD